MTYEITSHLASTKHTFLRSIFERLASTKCTFFLLFRRGQMIGKSRFERPYNEKGYFFGAFLAP